MKLKYFAAAFIVAALDSAHALLIPHVCASNDRGIIDVSNDLRDFGIDPGNYGDGGEHGVVCSSNSANFDAQNLSEALTNYVQANQEKDEVQLELDKIFPPIPVSRAFEYRIIDDRSDFQIDDGGDDIRQIGGEFKEIKPRGKKTNGRTENKGLQVSIDNDQGGTEPGIQQFWTKNLRDRLMRTELYRGYQGLLSNAVEATTGSKNWGGSGTPWDPDGDLAQLLLDSGDDRGQDSNMLIMSRTAWQRRFRALGFTTNPALTGTRNTTPEALASILGVDTLFVSNRRYQSGADNSARSQTKKQVLDGAGSSNIRILACLQQAGMNMYDASNVKRFVSACQDGSMMRVFVKTNLKTTVIAVEHYSVVTVTSTLGLRYQTVTFT